MKKIILISIAILLMVLPVVLNQGCQKYTEGAPSKESIENQANISSVSPSITSIGGYTDNFTCFNGKWNATVCSHTSIYNNYYCMDCYYSSPSSSPYFWTISGSGFGATQGSGIVKLLPQGLTGYIVNWSNTLITVKFSSYPTNFTASSCTLSLTNSSNLTTTRAINVLGLLYSRGFGQCTWEVANQRILAHKTIPSPSAYQTNGTINSSYAPQQYDVVFFDWDGNGTLDHTAIITSVPVWYSPSNYYTFTLTERNALCNETLTTRTCTFYRNSNTGLYSAAYPSSHQATKYFR